MDLFKLLGTITIKNSDAIDALDETSKKGQEAESKLSKSFKTIGKGALTVGKAVGTGLLMAGTAVAGLVTNATSAYAEYEQLVGGVDTLFKESSAKVQAYAEKAYETAGMSANEYMNTVTSFSASLLQSLGGDTEKAADKADVAIRDMSDNANKMGTSMEMIQNAYQGFAKQNYTMLDNLKLGYGGTKEEMQRLLDDAEKLSGQKFDISSYSDIVDAIHVVQTEMGITGTTAQEASGTISGSLSSVKGAWTNLVTALASDDLPLDEYINKFVDSASTMVGNMLPRIQQALGGVVKLVEKITPTIIETLPGLLSELLPSVISTAENLLNSIVSMLPQLTDMLVTSVIPQLLSGIVTISNALTESLPLIIQSLSSALPTLIPMLINGLISIFVTLCTVLPQAIQPLIDSLPMILESIHSALISNLHVILNGLHQLIIGLIPMIPQLLHVLLNAIFINFQELLAGELLYKLLPEILVGAALITWELIKALPSLLWAVVKVLVLPFIQTVSAIIGIFKPIIPWLGDIFGKAKDKAVQAWSDFKGKMAEKWNDVKAVFSNVGKWFGEKFSDAWNRVKNVFSGVKSFFLEKWNQIKDVFSSLGTTISDAISGAVKQGINSVISGTENIVNGFFGMINGAIDMINKIPNVNISKIQMVEFTRLAKGGVVDKATPAIFGEDGAEAVVPLENNTGWLNKVALKLHEFSLQYGGYDSSLSIRSVELQQMQVSELQMLNVTANKILDAILTMDENMGGHLREAMDGVSLDVNKREFARLVKGVN